MKTSDLRSKFSTRFVNERPGISTVYVGMCALKKRLSRLENLQTQGLVISTDTKVMFQITLPTLKLQTTL